jgi:hypothetical protein
MVGCCVLRKDAVLLLIEEGVWHKLSKNIKIIFGRRGSLSPSKKVTKRGVQE